MRCPDHPDGCNELSNGNEAQFLFLFNSGGVRRLMRTNGLTDYIKRNFIEKLKSIVCPNFTASVVEKTHKKAPEATWQEFTSKEFRVAALPGSWGQSLDRRWAN